MHSYTLISHLFLGLSLSKQPKKEVSLTKLEIESGIQVPNFSQQLAYLVEYVVFLSVKGKKMRIRSGKKEVPIKVTTVEVGYNDLGLCDTSDVAFYKLWYQPVSH
jgi:hypothetical protein